MRRRDLNPGDLFVYLESAHPRTIVGELRYVRGSHEHVPAIPARPSPADGGWMGAEVLDCPVVRVTLSSE